MVLVGCLKRKEALLVMRVRDEHSVGVRMRVKV